MKKIKKLIKELKIIDEDGVVNVVGGGAIAGVGVGPQGEPGVHPEDQPANAKIKSDFPKSKPPVMSGLFKRKPPKN